MINIRMTKLAIFPLAVFLLYAPLTSDAKTFSAKVVRVIDGDTVQAYDGTTNTRIRLYGIDAPESNQAFGQKAKQIMIQLVANQVVHIQVHGQDVYGRMLGTIYLKNKDINAIMVADGMAWAYRYKGRLIVPEYGALEQNARNERKGLWSNPHSIEPRQWRKANN
ncbi:thermonuclease family protein (plasmid) [Klebsiella michiganensis]|uniref:thermonuclease family protein n=1 Tax=Klebsiella michiganensis TaxID=1134687 RepID=UPI0021D8954F|nr:thermonuclease family protein [Klebsiella michiganensis]UYB60236.1 thermonuclease family protein [Klebsiella michiganensis]